MIFEIKPLSVNKCWAGRRFKTPEYKQFEKDLSILIKEKKLKKFKGEVEIDIFFRFKNKLSDIDNCVKPILDILVKNGIIEDDRMIRALFLFKDIAKNDSFTIYIENYDKNKTKTNR